MGVRAWVAVAEFGGKAPKGPEAGKGVGTGAGTGAGTMGAGMIGAELLTETLAGGGGGTETLADGVVKLTVTLTGRAETFEEGAETFIERLTKGGLALIGGVETLVVTLEALDGESVALI